MVITNDLRRRMLEEHRNLRCAQEDLITHFETFCEQPAPEGQKELRSLLDEFALAVRRHFSFEEKDGYLTMVVERRPHHTARVESLREEHGQILEVLEQLEKDLDADLRDEAALRAFKKDFAALITLFGRHEQAEQELVMDVFWLEGGVSD